MHYFIIHSGTDYDDVMRLMNQWSDGLSRFRCSVLKGTKNDWHDDVRAEIRSAEKVIYVVGKTSGTNENINWELNVALEENKEIYVYRLSSDYEINKILNTEKKRLHVQKGEKDGELVFSPGKPKVTVVSDGEITAHLQEDDLYISSRLESKMQENLDIAMRQYEMFVETSEELVRRKQNVNSFYITINSLIISVVLGAFALSKDSVFLGHSALSVSLIVCLASLVGGIICFSWHSVLRSYADLNGSKMKIISYIESQLAYNLYDTEWQLVSKKMGNRKYKSFSEKEMFIAKLFLFFYLMLFVAGILFGSLS